MDYLIRTMKNKIISDLNETEIPMEVKRLVLGEILREVSLASESVISEQIEQLSKKEEV